MKNRRQHPGPHETLTKFHQRLGDIRNFVAQSHKKKNDANAQTFKKTMFFEHQTQFDI